MKRVGVPLLLMTVVGLLACGIRSPVVRSCAGTRALPADLGRAERVLIVTIDGLRPDMINPTDTPTLDRLAREGAYSRWAKTVLPPLTLPAHTSILSGVPPELHGVTWNQYEPERGRIETTTIFDIAHAAGLSTALFGGKKKLKHLLKPGVPDRGSSPTRPGSYVVDEAIEYLSTNTPHLALIHLPDVDSAGHDYGWKSKAQREALRSVDHDLGRLLEALSEAAILESLLLIVTADHGGDGPTHVDGEILDLRIPWIAWGVGVSPSRLPSVCVTATAAASLRALGLEVPVAWPGGR